MNFLEALKTRKPMRRPYWAPGYYWIRFLNPPSDEWSTGAVLCWNDHVPEFSGDGAYIVPQMYMNVKDFLADDWEIKDENSNS